MVEVMIVAILLVLLLWVLEELTTKWERRR
jgi:uncharacterized membrane protein YcaP (DUF421 family)